MSRAVLLAAALAGCVGLEARPDGRLASEPFGALEVAWAPPAALWVEVRDAETGRLAWRAEAGMGRLGVQPLGSPLPVAALGPPPGVSPPDGRGPTASAPSLEAGARYGVTVGPCCPGLEAPRPTCEPLPETAGTLRRSGDAP